MPSSQSDDTGADREVLKEKRSLREEVWARLEGGEVDRFPGARGRIPNFVGAEDAAERLRGAAPWSRAAALKANPDSPQWPVRQRALEDGKRVYMAVPRLAEEDPFFLLDPDELEESPRKASSIKGASRNARTVGVEELSPVDLIVVGSVAVSRDGARLGKGGGFSDLEFALAREAGLVDGDTTVVTTVHPLQILDSGRIPMGLHDVPVDLLITPDDVISCAGAHRRPTGILWDQLPDEKIREIPLLRRVKNETRSPGSP